MKSIYVSGYGHLEYLAPDEYFAGPWQYLRSAFVDGVFVDIVCRSDYVDDIRYTFI